MIEGNGYRTRTGRSRARQSDSLSFYANIPVPTSCLCIGSQGGFFEGFDYRAQAGIIHVEDAELRTEREKDRIDWEPLKRELKALRRAARIRNPGPFGRRTEKLDEGVRLP